VRDSVSFSYFAEQSKNFLPRFSLDDFLPHLKAGDQLLSLHHLGLANALQRFRFHPALLEDAENCAGISCGMNLSTASRPSTSIDGLPATPWLDSESPDESKPESP